MTDYVDFHTHSTASDGELTPYELVKKAKETNLSKIALTDHDTVNGLDEFERAGKSFCVSTVAGIELSAAYKCEMHILGLYINHKIPDFTDMVNKLKEYRKQRNIKMIEALVNNGFNISMNDLLALNPDAKPESVGRSHMARALVDKGYYNSVKDAFNDMLANDKPAYVAREKLTVEECVKLIHTAGGYAVLAHPVYITQDEQELNCLVRELKEKGMDGIECYYSQYTNAYTKLCLQICKKYNMKISGGSDFHGSSRAESKLGRIYTGQFLARNLTDF